MFQNTKNEDNQHFKENLFLFLNYITLLPGAHFTDHKAEKDARSRLAMVMS